MTAQIIPLNSKWPVKKIAPVVQIPARAAANFCIALGLFFLLCGMATACALGGRE